MSIPKRNDLEIIVVDDRSTDKKNIEKILDRCVFITNTSSKKSAGVCRNIGMKKAKGDWILFADSDDLFIDNAFDIFDLYKNYKEDIIFFKPTSTNKGTGKLSDRHIPLCDLVNDFILCGDESIRYKSVVPWSKLIRKEFLEKHNVSFDEVIASNDVMFSLKSGFYANKVLAVDKVVYNVVRREGSLTSNRSIPVVQSRLLVTLVRNDFLYRHGLKQYQLSLFSIIALYREVLTFDILKELLISLVKGEQRIFPKVSSIKKSRYFLSNLMKNQF